MRSGSRCSGRADVLGPDVELNGAHYQISASCRRNSNTRTTVLLGNSQIKSTEIWVPLALTQQRSRTAIQ